MEREGGVFLYWGKKKTMSRIEPRGLSSADRYLQSNRYQTGKWIIRTPKTRLDPAENSSYLVSCTSGLRTLRSKREEGDIGSYMRVCKIIECFAFEEFAQLNRRMFTPSSQEDLQETGRKSLVPKEGGKL